MQVECVLCRYTTKLPARAKFELNLLEWFNIFETGAVVILKHIFFTNFSNIPQKFRRYFKIILCIFYLSCITYFFIQEVFNCAELTENLFTNMKNLNLNDPVLHFLNWQFQEILTSLE